MQFPGHTEYLARAFDAKRVGMMFVSNRLKTIIVTRHIPLRRVHLNVTTKNVFDTICLAEKALKQHFRIRRPKLAVCGLNPHAGEKGEIGDEEITQIIPAIRKAKQKNIIVTGPLPADTLFAPERSNKYDAIIAMYHDQGLIPIKTLYFSELVNLTVGLPFIRTSPAHGTAFDIAGKNKADPSSMAAAIKLAAELS
jgi:4-hydroxythreonine-4-phosphate dehydrogenase